MEFPSVGSFWQHKKGTFYKVVAIANQHSDKIDEFPVTVVYQDMQDRIWSRPLYRWHGSMTEIKPQKKKKKNFLIETLVPIIFFVASVVVLSVASAKMYDNNITYFVPIR